MIKVQNVASFHDSLIELLEYVQTVENIEIIVPDKLSLYMEKFLFERLNIESSFNIKVSTLNRFAKKNVEIKKENQISKTGSVLLVHKILNENFDKLLTLKSKTYSFTYAEEIFNTIAQLKASKILPEEMLKFESSEISLKDKIQDLALIYEEYEKNKAGLLDASDCFLISVFSVSDGRKNQNLVFVGFDDFTAVEYSIIEQLSLENNVKIFNYNSKKSNKHIYNSEVVEQLRNISLIRQIPFEIETSERHENNVRQFLQDNVFSTNLKEKELQDDEVRVFSCKDKSQEIEVVARDIKSKVINGQKFENFGVAVFGLESLSTKIKEIFEKYEINYYIDEQISLNKSVFYKFLLSLMKYNLESYNLCHLIDLINSPFIMIEDDRKISLIKRLNFLNLKGKLNFKHDLGVEFEEDKNVLIEFLSYFDFTKNETAFDVINRYKKVLKDLNFNDQLVELSLANEDLQTSILLKKSFENVDNLFDEILKFYPYATAQEFYDIFLRVGGLVKINNLPLSLDCVKIVDANNSMEIFKDFYVVNCTHENAPSTKYDCGIILDSEIEKLNFSHKLSPTISHINRLARLRLYNLITSFESALTVTYSHNPSEVILGIKKMFDLPILSIFEYGKYEALSEWDNIEAICKYDKENKEIFEKIIKNKEINNKNLKNLSIFKEFSTISASQLENYFKCPFYSFLTNLLKIKPELKNDVLSLDVGNIIHEILYVYYKRDKKVGEIQNFIDGEIERIISKDERLKLNADNPIIKNLKEETLRVINGLNYIDENSLFKIDSKKLEFDFSGENSLKLKNVDIIGKIDRVDEFGDLLRIVDYKTGKADASLKELYYGNKLQLFLYANAIERITGKKVVGEFYLPIRNNYTKEEGNPYSMKGFFFNDEDVLKALDKRLVPGEKSDIVNVKMNSKGLANKTIGYKELENSQMNDLKSYAIKVSEKAVDEIKSGVIDSSPSSVSNPCEYCPYVHVCLKSSRNVKSRDVNKINLDSFKEEE